MKLFLILLMTTMMMSVPTLSFAKDNNTTTVQYAGKSSKFAVMVPDVLHFRAAITTAEQMQMKEKKTLI